MTGSGKGSFYRTFTLFYNPNIHEKCVDYLSYSGGALCLPNLTYPHTAAGGTGGEGRSPPAAVWGDM